jgi:hypothetical protein
VRTFAIIAALVLFACGCGEDGSYESEDYGNLLNSPQGLVLVEEEHPAGWGRPDCFLCHEVRNMHTVNRTGLPDLDLGEIRDLVRSQGEASCAQCHGANGVAP